MTETEEKRAQEEYEAGEKAATKKALTETEEKIAREEYAKAVEKAATEKALTDHFYALP